ncbi:plasmid replication initiator TrfA [Cupriavidus metallidurans]|uniref:plasmid replication initiator TrfA n=1 Tax=Cupriavidus metallidurans TaxID=119219 RepID=UPI001CCDF0F5|nr:plasmid replication initiator TrfA [Cupriavidus metallidurans]UBM12731.1 replication initiator protein A [Cupriavidus metallidurans]
MKSKRESSPELPQRVQELSKRALAKKAATDLSKQTQLPLWDRNQRGMPNTLARSALFNCNKASGQRKDYKNFPVASLPGAEITYTGEELRQDDADVFLEICHLARETPLGDRVEFTAYSMLKALGWGRSTKAYARLSNAIDRLKANMTKVKFADGRKGFGGSLVRKFGWSDEEEGGEGGSRRWIVYMEPEIVALFSEDDYTRLAREQRALLSGDLAKWLHSYYHTHAVPFPHKVSFIHEKCGSQTKQLYHFRPVLKKALAELVEVGFLEDWHIDDATDIVYVTRIPKQLRAA